MKKLLFLFLAMAATTLSFAFNNPTNPELTSLENGKAKIESEFSKINKIEQIIEAEGLTFEQLETKYPNLVTEVNLASEMEDGIFDGADDVPLGIPGFFWGLCLSWVGMLIVYLMMDEGEDRKEQIKNALFGCIGFAVIYVLFWFVILGSAGFWVV